MASRFCADCGAPYAGDDARFCVQCGVPRPGVRMAGAGFSFTRYPAAFVVVAVLVAGGVAVVAGNYNAKPAPQVPAPAPTSKPLSENHPPVEIPEEVKKALADLKKTAEGKPDDPQAWRYVAGAMLRASQIDRAYLTDAEDAYRRVLTLVPDDLEALRGLGNIAYDRDQYDTAIELYRHYLKKKPDDLSVQTDLGTMYLSKGDYATATQTYEGVLKSDPKFFQAHFNLAIVYRSAGQTDAAIASLETAKGLATDDDAKAQVEMLLSRLQGAPAAAAPPPQAPAGDAAGKPEGSFRENIEAIFRQNPVMASKVQRFEWVDDGNAKLYLAEFPMDQMGEQMRSMFLERMRGRIRQNKQSFQVTTPLRVELIDFATGRVMETIAE